MKERKLNNNLEAVLININRYINIDSDRQQYAGHFENVKNILFSKLRELSPFGYLFNGWQLGGSYGDNLKVGLPNEFDMVFHITFPENSLIIVKKDHSLPGNVHLDFTKVLQKIARERQHELNLRYLKTWLDDSNYLLVEKLQSFIQSCFYKVLLEMDNHVKIGSESAFMRYTRQGPAHTIAVSGYSILNGEPIQYSIDFVPGILLEEDQNVIISQPGQWEAIPKPAYFYQPDYISFRSSFYRQEQYILKNNLNLKNVLRMMKKFRDSHSNMFKMKSYFIKTLFLWKAKQESGIYWQKSVTEIIIDMFISMENSLRKSELRFFWDDRLNMYDRYSSTTITEMYYCVQHARVILEQAAYQKLNHALQNRVYNMFLTSNERVTLESSGGEYFDPEYVKQKEPEYVKKKEPEYGFKDILKFLLIGFISFFIFIRYKAEKK